MINNTRNVELQSSQRLSIKDPFKEVQMDQVGHKVVILKTNTKIVDHKVKVKLQEEAMLLFKK